MAGAILLPDLELGFLLEQADEHRRLQVHVLLAHPATIFWGIGLLALALVASDTWSASQPASGVPADNSATEAKSAQASVYVLLHSHSLSPLHREIHRRLQAPVVEDGEGGTD